MEEQKFDSETHVPMRVVSMKSFPYDFKARVLKPVRHSEPEYPFTKI